jgi:hypothetical protein
MDFIDWYSSQPDQYCGECLLLLISLQWIVVIIIIIIMIIQEVTGISFSLLAFVVVVPY